MLEQNAIRAHPKKHWFIFIAMLAIPLSGLSIDVNVPSLPALSHHFHTNDALAQLTITAYMIGLGVFQLFAGSLSDSWGRKKPFVVSMIVFISASLLAPWATDIYQLLTLRFIQGVAVACSSVPMRAVFSDLYEGKEFYRMANYMNMAWALGPIIAPAIGGYLQTYFGWQAPFYFLAIYAAILLVINISFMPETLFIRQPLKLRVVADNYRQMLTNRQYLIGLLCLGLIYSFMVLFGVIGPFLVQGTLHYSAIEFGHMALLMGVAWFLGNMTNRLLINLNAYKKILMCFWFMLAGVAVMTAIAIIIPMHIYNIIIPSFYLLYIGGIAFPNFFAGNMALFPKIAGSANALMGASMMFITGVVTALATLFKSDTQMPLTLMYGLLAIICLVACYADKRLKN